MDHYNEMTLLATIQKCLEYRFYSQKYQKIVRIDWNLAIKSRKNAHKAFNPF